LPRVAAGLAELDSWDFVEGLVLQGGPEVEVLNVIALHSGLIGSWLDLPYTAVRTLEGMLGHWREVGLPEFAQFDNDTRFQGAHQYADVVSRVMRLCLHLASRRSSPSPANTGSKIDSKTLTGAGRPRYGADFITIRSPRSKRDRRPMSRRVECGLPRAWHGQMIFLRRTSDTGTVELLQHRFPVGAVATSTRSLRG
jgi:hypothetical protein